MATDKDDDTDRYWMHPTGSEKNSTPKVHLLKTTSPDRAAQHRSDWITKCAQQILSSYRKDDFADPDGYFVQLAMVLERYDDAVIRAVTSPITGIQRTCKFPPSIAEVAQFIDEHIRRTNYASQFAASAEKQLRERKEIETENEAEPLEHRRKVVARFLAECRAAERPETKPHWKQFSTEELLAKYPQR